MTPAERMIYTRGYQNGYKAIRRAGKEQREQRIEELENENVEVKQQRGAAEAKLKKAEEENQRWRMSEITETQAWVAKLKKAEEERDVHFEAAGALRTRLRQRMDERDVEVAAEARAKKAEEERDEAVKTASKLLGIPLCDGCLMGEAGKHLHLSDEDNE
jgi:hypothetical protein